ncbi:hypothetical protein [Bacillus sp. FJAT-45066]|uniref:hypothetical protein n=1 Tax=Bacillus sp. FJAT-45066 TaxID=2011010 RepID=UPI000BB8A030|nr:hypothetical protein [Bacillus sp. FJAT-45066]
MENENSGSIYIHMIVGSIGIILIFAGLFYHNSVEKGITSLLIPIGIVITVNYMYFLEKRAGISNKVIWIQSLSMIGVLAFLLFL